MSLKLLTAGLASVAFASLALTACNTDPTDAPATGVDTVTVTAALMAHPWKISTATASPAITKNGRLITNVLDSLQSPCDKHTIAHYLSSDSLSVSTDSSGCGLGRGTWTRSGYTVTTVFNKDGGPETTVYTVVSVTSTRLVLTWVAGSAQAGDGVSHTVTETYIAQ